MTLPKVSRNNSSNRVGKPLELGQGRLKQRVPVAVIDIGSNSVRQVIYEGLTRAPAVLFNEKILCGLGEGLVASGKLNEIAVERALRAIRRFVALQDQTHVGEVHIVATAAARDASNGPDFIRRVHELTDCDVEVLTGEMEAYYAALGIKAGFHHPVGIVGDLGGGSLELAGINGGVEDPVSLPLGGLRLRELASDDLDKARKIARDHFRDTRTKWPNSASQGRRTFFAVGGTWRSLGKLHIANQHYPMPSVHEYQIDGDELSRFCRKILDEGLDGFRGINAVSKNRRELLPYGAVVLREFISAYEPDRIALSSLGVREGFLYSRLKATEKAKDSLLVGARDLSVLRARSPDHCVELAEWTGAAFATLGINETEDDRRHRIAACYLADIGWRAHPDFRAQQALEVIANAGFVSISHEGRAYLAMASYHRYQGLSPKVGEPDVAALASADAKRKARVLAGLFRVLYLFSASTPGVLPSLGFERTGDNSFSFIVPVIHADLVGERPSERLRQLAKELEVEIELEIRG